MTTNNFKNYFVMFVLIISASSMAQNNAFAATPTDLGTAGSYAILSGDSAGVITNGAPGQLISRGNVGHASTETPAGSFTFAAGFSDVSTGLGTILTPGTPIGDAHTVYTNIGTWDGATNTGMACTFTFANGAIDLSTDVSHGAMGQYGPGVYCIDGAASIGTTGINFNAAGTYVFKINGALTTVAGSTVTFTGAAGGSDANSGNLFWASVAAFSSSATSQFSGTVMTGPAAITTGANTDNTNARFISESAITIGGGANFFSSPPTTTTGTGDNDDDEHGTGDNDKCQHGTGDNDKGEQHGTGDNDKGEHGTGDNDKCQHGTDDHDKGEHDQGHHDKGEHDKGEHDKGHHDKDADSKSGKN